MIFRGLLRTLQLLQRPCRDMSGLISASLDRELTRPERVAVRVHTLYCGACRRFRRQVELIRALLAGWIAGLGAGDVDTATGPGLSAETRARIERAIREAS